MPVDLVARRFKERIRIRRIRCDDVARTHHPQAHAFLATRIDIARVLDRHSCIGGVKAPHVLVLETRTRADEHLEQRPVVRYRSAHYLASSESFRLAACVRACRLCAWAAAASRTQAPSVCARRRASSRSRLQGPLPLRTDWNSFQSIA